MARDIARRRTVLAFMGEREVHYADVAKLLGIRPDVANSLLSLMAREKLTERVGKGKWVATGREPVQDARRPGPGWPEKPELARVW